MPKIESKKEMTPIEEGIQERLVEFFVKELQQLEEVGEEVHFSSIVTNSVVTLSSMMKGETLVVSGEGVEEPSGIITGSPEFLQYIEDLLVAAGAKGDDE